MERAIRPIALNRKNAVFGGTDGGGEHWATVASLICKLSGIDPLSYLTDIITKIVSGHPNSQTSVPSHGAARMDQHLLSPRSVPLTWAQASARPKRCPVHWHSQLSLERLTIAALFTSRAKAFSSVRSHSSLAQGANCEAVRWIMMTCVTCDGIGWVCSNHGDRPWLGLSALRQKRRRLDACGCGPGAPCPSCHPEGPRAVDVDIGDDWEGWVALTGGPPGNRDRQPTGKPKPV